jgi:hypothetical protein
MTPHEQRAWDRLTADMEGDMHQYDYWQDVAENVRTIYLNRILLEDAARAAGIELVWSTMQDVSPRRTDSYDAWNPLTDDGDALRLAVHLRLLINQAPHAAIVEGQHKGIIEPYVDHAGNPYAATRRAIVRAAAALAAA